MYQRLLLFDIDGTLLSAGGAARRSFERALHTVYGTAGPIDGMPFDGMTDPQIARELLSAAGLDDASIDAGLQNLFDEYLDGLVKEVSATDHVTHVYPGVRELLDALATDESVVLGLLTGNAARGADIKLGSAGLREYFRLGAFGSDCEQRTGLPAIAVQRALESTGRAFSGHEVVIIGDTPMDIRCGESLGVFTVGVTTGRFGRDELLSVGAASVFDDFTDTAGVLRVLTGRS